VLPTWSGKDKSVYKLVGLTAIAVLVVLATVGAGWGIGDVTAQESETAPQDGVAGSAAESDINLVPRTDEGEKTTMEVGETLSIGFGAEEENYGGTVIAEAEDEYLWRIHRTDEGSSGDNQLLYTKSSDFPELDGEDQPNSARVTSFRPTKPGNYVIEVETPNVETFRSDSAEGPHIGHTVEIEVLPSQDKSLLEEHSPVLNFHPDEMYYPTRIEAIVDNSYLCDDEPPGAQGDLVYDMATLKDISGGGASLYTQPYALEERQVSIRGCNAPIITGGFPSGVLTEYNPSNSVYPANVYGTVIEPGDRPVDNLSFSPGDEHTSDYQNAGFEPPSEGGSYTVLVYFMTYVNDPKPENAQGFFDELAGHTGDVEPVWILLEDREPEWLLAKQHFGGESLNLSFGSTAHGLLAKQHFGGEYRKWENVEKENGHPVIYPAEGAHTNFLGIGTGETDAEVRTVDDTHSAPLNNPSDNPQYIYQQQYLCPKFRDGPRGDTTIAEFFFNNVDNYIDVIGFLSNSGNREGEIWVAEESDVTVSSDEEYEVSVLTGKEVWSDYAGDLYRYPNTPRTEGDVHHQTATWQDPGGRGEDILFPDVAQIDGTFSDSDTKFNIPRTDDPDRSDSENIQGDIVSPDGRGLDCSEFAGRGDCDKAQAPPPIVKKNDRVTPEEADGSVGVNVINTGMQPHEFTDGLLPRVVEAR